MHPFSSLIILLTLIILVSFIERIPIIDTVISHNVVLFGN
jgi:uncharacterized membrane protein